MDVIREISPNDRMMTPADPEIYFLLGDSALQCVRLAIDAVGKGEPASILDFACGHGRVLRTLKAAYPDARLTACDTNRDAVDFCARTFGATGVYSDDDLGAVQLGRGFDLIWVGSLFTHLPAASWAPFLKFLVDRLARDGLLLFTTHGRWYAERIRANASPLGGVSEEAQLEMLRAYDEIGFGFARSAHRDTYGLSLSSPSAVVSEVQALTGVRLVLYLERGWRGWHDVIACQNGFTTPDSQARADS